MAVTYVTGTTAATATLYIDGATQRSTDVSAWNTSLVKGRLGASNDGRYVWGGAIAEVILYSGTLTATQIQKVNSYLALKYSLKYANTDYLASDGSTIWSQTTNNGYQNEIAGIGRDDASG